LTDERNIMSEHELHQDPHDMAITLNDWGSFLKLLAAAPLFATLSTRKLAAALSNTAAKAAAGGSTHSLTSGWEECVAAGWCGSA
jgi:hypothetical protein